MKILILAPVLALALTGVTAIAADAHTATFAADCNGVVVHATSYDGNRHNHWSVTVDGHTTSGTFTDAYDQTFPVPQDGATTSWSATVEAENGDYHFTDSGTVGPCGTPPPATHKKHASYRVTSYCNGVFLEHRKNATVTKAQIRPGVYRFAGVGVDGAAFRNGTDHRTIVRHTKRFGCGSGS